MIDKSGNFPAYIEVLEKPREYKTINSHSKSIY
jgi:hypothetical protein